MQFEHDDCTCRKSIFFSSTTAYIFQQTKTQHPPARLWPTQLLERSCVQAPSRSPVGKFHKGVRLACSTTFNLWEVSAVVSPPTLNWRTPPNVGTGGHPRIRERWNWRHLQPRVREVTIGDVGFQLAWISACYGMKGWSERSAEGVLREC